MRSLILTAGTLAILVVCTPPALAASDTCDKIRRVATSAVVDGFSSESAGQLAGSGGGKYLRCKTILAGVKDPEETCNISMVHTPSWSVSWELSPGANAYSEAKATAEELSACLPNSRTEVSVVKGHWRIFWPVANGIARLRIDASVRNDPVPHVDLTVEKK